MNLVELYQQTPVERHRDIKVVGDRVFVKDTEGSVDEYLISEDEELWLIHSERKERQDIQAIKSKLGIVGTR